MGLGLIGVKESWEEFKTPNFWRDCMVDCYLTFMLLFVNILCSADQQNYSLAVGMVTGMIVFANIEGYGHVQWAVMNPVVAVNFMFTKKISFLRCFFYIAFDLLACVCVAYFSKAVLPEEIVSAIGPARPGLGVTPLQAMGIEWVLVIAHQSAILGTLDDKNRAVMIPGLAIGMATFAGISASFKFTGGILNPFAVFHAGILSGDFSTQWIYWTGDMLGGLTALLLYNFSIYNKGVFKTETEEEEEEEEGKEAGTKDKLLENSKEKDKNANVEDNEDVWHSQA